MPVVVVAGADLCSVVVPAMLVVASLVVVPLSSLRLLALVAVVCRRRRT